MSAPRILFMGTPEFAVASLNALVNAGHQVVGVVTAADKPAGRGRQLRMSAVKERALELGLPVLQPERLRDPAFLQALDALGADLYVVVAFRMLPEVVWTKPALGTINLHGSLLPQYRGAAPINWAMINGETKTGATTFFIRHEIDTGDIIDRVELPIGPEMTAGELHDGMMMKGAALLERTVASIAAGTARKLPQTGAPGTLKHAPKLTPENCRIRWTNSAHAVYDHVRGLSPYPGAWTLMRTAKGTSHFKVLAARVHGSLPNKEPGTVVTDGNRLVVHCGEGALELLEVQPEGRKRMGAGEFVRGAQNAGTISFE